MPYVNGVRDGKFIIYDNRINAVSGYFDEGHPSGSWQIDDLYHNPQVYLTFNDSLSLVEFKDLTSGIGNETHLGYFNRYNQRTGHWKILNFYGDVRQEVNFKNGFLNGDFSMRGPGGKLDVQGEYVLNEKVGDWKYFNNSGRVAFLETNPKTVIMGKELSNFVNQNEIIVSPKRLYSRRPEIVSGDTAYFIKYMIMPKMAGMELLPQPEFEMEQFDFFVPHKQYTEFDFVPEFTPPKWTFDIDISTIEVPVDVYGNIWVLLDVNQLGILEEVKIIKTIQPVVDAQVKQYVEGMPPMVPARYQVMPVDCKLIIALGIY